MLQRSRSKSISKIRYLIIIPVMMAMLTLVACSDALMPKDSNLESYSYTLVKGQEKSSEANAAKYENFLNQNPDYVGWRIVDHEKETVEYSIHPKDEKVPEDFKDYAYILPGGEETVLYVKEISPYANTTVKVTEVPEGVGGLADVPFAVVEQVPMFPGCEDLSSNEERKKCMAEKVHDYVMRNFNTSIGKESGLKGIQRIITVFKISPEGNITDVRARAPHPDLEAEAIRVVGSLPQMKPGVHKGKNVGVSYSLPMVFQVSGN